MDLDLEQVVKLARIDLTPEEKERIEPQMAEILKYVEQLKELDVTDVEPTAHAMPLANVMREDVVEDSLSHDDALRNAPKKSNGLFVVPKIVE
jgi:aspartyl-tRNA(Asn)/glutamyl-tRNA(Gln) amidotransferase subunit C